MGSRPYALALARPFAVDGFLRATFRRSPSATARSCSCLRAPSSWFAAASVSASSASRIPTQAAAPRAASPKPSLPRAHRPSLRPASRARSTLSRFSGVILFSDFLDPIELIREHVEALAASGASGHLVQILDPAEETLPYEGRTEFLSPEGGAELDCRTRRDACASATRRASKPTAKSCISLATRLGWSFMVHHTDRPAAEPLLTLVMRLEGRDGGYRWTRLPPPAHLSSRRAGRARHDTSAHSLSSVPGF